MLWDHSSAMIKKIPQKETFPRGVIFTKKDFTSGEMLLKT